MSASLGSEDGDVGFQIAPMVDVVFVLLLFFMASAGMQMVEKELSVRLPSRGPGHEEPVIVDISVEGVVTVNNQLFGTGQTKGLAEVRAWFQRSIETFGDGPVIVRPSNETRQERIIDVLDALAGAGVKKLSFG